MKHTCSVFALFFVLGLGVRFPSLIDTIKTDENATLLHHEADDLSGMFYSWRDHPGANYLSYFSAKLFPLTGNGLPEARLPSYLAGSLTIALLAASVFLYTGSCRAAFWAGSFLLLSEEHVYFSTSVRGYGLQTCGIFILHLLFLRYLRRPSWLLGLAYVLLGVCTLWCHLWAVYVIVAHFILAWWDNELPWRDKVFWSLATTLALMAIFLLMESAIPEILQGDKDDVRTRSEIWDEFWWAIRYNTRYFNIMSPVLFAAFWATFALSLKRWWSKEALMTAGVLVAVPCFLLLHPPGAFGSRYVVFYIPLFYLFWGLLLGQVTPLNKDLQKTFWPTLLSVQILFLVLAHCPGTTDVVLGLQSATLYIVIALFFTAWDPQMLHSRYLMYALGLSSILLAVQFFNWICIG